MVNASNAFAEMEHADSPLSEEDRMLVVLRDELYEGRWDLMKHDLQDRLAGRPYVFKLVNRIQDDLRRIERLEHRDLVQAE